MAVALSAALGERFPKPARYTVLLTARRRARDIASHAERTGVNAVQVVNHIEPYEAARLAELLPPSVRYIQVVHVDGADALDRPRLYAPYVDAFLLDSGRPAAPTPELGGTGQTHDWSVSARIVEQATRPVFLAGGLRACNVAAAIRQVRPYALDVCTGVRTSDVLDPSKLNAFMREVHEMSSSA
ncbi:phosphoribosylanthranilate isomerase [Rhodovibrio sodomensis]|uniref:phosphoribosylanthranilate isomerase n=1 Tax=Rhodovibrio sodomensis TaxID=1088 RepID=UPI0019084B09